MRPELHALASLVSNLGGDTVQKSLDNFICERDEDVSLFLKEFAIEKELSHELRTYVVVDEDSNDLVIAGFFAVGITVVEETANDDQTGKDKTVQTPVYLLSQIARDDKYSHEELNGVELLQHAEECIREASECVGGKAIFLDCKEALLSYYKDKGYYDVILDEETNLYRMAKPIFPE